MSERKFGKVKLFKRNGVTMIKWNKAQIERMDRMGNEQLKSAAGWAGSSVAGGAFSMYHLNRQARHVSKLRYGAGMAGAVVAGVGAGMAVLSTALGAAHKINATRAKHEGAISQRSGLATLLGLGGLGIAAAFSKKVGAAPMQAGNAAAKAGVNALYRARDAVRSWRTAKDAAGAAAKAASEARHGKPVMGSVLNKAGKKVRFVRIRGRVVPIRTEIG